MRRILAAVLALCLLSGLASALAENAGWVVRPMATALDRVKLRAEPATSAKVLGKYYAGAAVELLDWGSKWDKVRIGGRTGYIMKEYLTQDTAEQEGQSGCVAFPEADGTLPLLSEPRSDAQVLLRMAQGEIVTVLGMVSQEWLHLHYRSDGQDLYGYASATAVTWAEESAARRVDTGEADKRLNLRAEPSRSSRSLGLYYNGTRVMCLFDYEATGSGWARVRVGSEVGFMQERQLTWDSSAYLPPLGVVSGSCTAYTSADKAVAAGYLSAGQAVAVAGSQEGLLLVELTPDDPGRDDYVWVDARAVEARDCAVSTSGSITASTPIFAQGGDGSVVDSGLPSIAAGTRCTVLGWYDETAKVLHTGYVSPQAAWVYVEVAQDGTVACFMPLTSVALPNGIMYPVGSVYQP